MYLATRTSNEPINSTIVEKIIEHLAEAGIRGAVINARTAKTWGVHPAEQRRALDWLKQKKKVRGFFPHAGNQIYFLTKNKEEGADWQNRLN